MWTILQGIILDIEDSETEKAPGVIKLSFHSGDTDNNRYMFKCACEWESIAYLGDGKSSLRENTQDRTIE